ADNLLMIFSALLAMLTLLAVETSPPRGTAAPSPPARLTLAEQDSIARAIEKDRESTREWLKSAPTSYLATVARRDFGAKTTLTVGSAPGSDVLIEDTAVASTHLRVT